MNKFQGQIYKNRRIRTVQKDGETWWVLKDLYELLGIGNPAEAMLNFPDCEKSVLSTTEAKKLGFLHASAGVNIINEPGLYRLIFKSSKPEAEAFKTWVFSEVLPSIRKTGKYDIHDIIGSQRIIETPLQTDFTLS